MLWRTVSCAVRSEKSTLGLASSDTWSAWAVKYEGVVGDLGDLPLDLLMVVLESEGERIADENVGSELCIE